MNGTFCYHNGQLQYSHKEFPEKMLPPAIVELVPGEYLSQEDLDDFYVSLLPVVNPLAIPDVFQDDAGNYFLVRLNEKEGFDLNEGDHCDVPDGVEVKEIYHDLDKWETRKAVRLSIKTGV